MTNLTQPRSKLTFSQQAHVRANMMGSAAMIARQLHEYIDTGELKVAGKLIEIDNTRLAAWRMVLDRTIPTLSATEITHKSGLESMDSGRLVERLALLVKDRPELASKLQEALGGKVIEGTQETQNPDTISLQSPTNTPNTPIQHSELSVLPQANSVSEDNDSAEINGNQGNRAE